MIEEFTVTKVGYDLSIALFTGIFTGLFVDYLIT
jgi:hypothetical protein